MEDRNAFRSAQGRSSRARPLRLKNSKTGCEFSIASRVRISSRSAGAPLGVEAARSLPALSPTPPCASRRRSRARRPLHTAIAPRTTIVHRHGGRGPAGPIPRTKHAGVGRRALVIVPDTRPIVHRSQLSKRVVVGAARARAGAGHGALVIVPAARFPLRTQAPAPPRLPPTSVIIFSLSISLSLTPTAYHTVS